MQLRTSLSLATCCPRQMGSVSISYGLSEGNSIRHCCSGMARSPVRRLPARKPSGSSRISERCSAETFSYSWCHVVGRCIALWGSVPLRSLLSPLAQRLLLLGRQAFRHGSQISHRNHLVGCCAERLDSALLERPWGWADDMPARGRCSVQDHVACMPSGPDEKLLAWCGVIRTVSCRKCGCIKIEAVMQLGFSVAGVAFLPVLFASNARWARSRLSGFEELQKHESKALLVLSCVG